MKLSISSDRVRQVIDMTDEVQAAIQGLPGSGCHVFVHHTTAAITTADLDPGTDQDYLAVMKAITPKLKFQHPHDPNHFPDHFWASVIGPDVTVPVEDGKLDLGDWQRIVLLEFSGPRTRNITAVIK